MQLPVKIKLLSLLCLTPLIMLQAAALQAAALKVPALKSTALELTGPETYENWYQIEVIIFSLNNPLPSEEFWPLKEHNYPSNMVSISPNKPELILPQTLEQLKIILSSPNNTSNGPDASTTNDGGALLQERGSVGERLFNEALPQAFRALNKGDRYLNSIAKSVSRSSRYKLLYHQAWRQPVISDEAPRPVLIQAGQHYDGAFQVDGTIGVRRSRFLHIVTDLSYTQFTSMAPDADPYLNPYQNKELKLEIPPEIPLQIASQYPKVMEWEATRGQFVPVHSDRLQHSRRMRRSTLHYIDHPRFGVLVQIEAFEWQAETLPD